MCGMGTLARALFLPSQFALPAARTFDFTQGRLRPALHEFSFTNRYVLFANLYLPMDTLPCGPRVQPIEGEFPRGTRSQIESAAQFLHLSFRERCHMTCRRPCRRNVSSTSFLFTTSSSTISKEKTSQVLALAVILLATFTCFAQEPSQDKDQPPTGDQQNSRSAQTQANKQRARVTIPAGTRVALVLTQPIESRYVRRGDDIYAQVNAPVDSGNEVVIPAGTFVQGQVAKLERKAGRGELRLQSMSITFPDGYVAPISGPATLETSDGYALNDPGPGRAGAALAAAFGGAGLGALIGHSVGSSSSTQTTTLPPGCVGPPPFCVSTSMTVPGRKGIDTGIGAVVGGAIGGVTAVALLASSHHFFLDAGAPIEMTLQQPVSLQQDEVAKAVQESAQHPIAEQPVVPRPVPPPPPDVPVDHGTCWTPGSPGTPPTVIPGTPGPDGVPGPPTIVPGTPPTPGTPYPCP
jgi:hypothetical protein